MAQVSNSPGDNTRQTCTCNEAHRLQTVLIQSPLPSAACLHHKPAPTRHACQSVMVLAPTAAIQIICTRKRSAAWGMQSGHLRTGGLVHDRTLSADGVNKSLMCWHYAWPQQTSHLSQMNWPHRLHQWPRPCKHTDSHTSGKNDGTSLQQAALIQAAVCRACRCPAQ